MIGEIKLNNIDKQKYSYMIKDVLIKDVLIKSMELDEVKFPQTNNPDFEVNLNYSCDEFSYYDLNNSNNNIIEFYPNFIIIINSNNEKTVNLKFTLRAIYEIKDLKEYEEEYLIKFMEKNLPINIWPYAREIISSITTRIGYPSLMIEPYRA